MLVVGCLTALAAQSPSAPRIQAKVVETQELRVVDESGRLVAALGTPAETPHSTSLRLYDRSKSGNDVLAARLSAVDGGGEFDLTGDARHGEIWMTTASQGASIDLSLCCTDPSHLSPDGAKIGVGQFHCTREGSSVWLAKNQNMTRSDGKHGEMQAPFFIRAPDAHLDDGGK